MFSRQKNPCFKMFTTNQIRTFDILTGRLQDVAHCATIALMVFVRKLIWDTWNVQHIARHHVLPEEIEEICHESPVILQGQQKKRLILIGVTNEDRMLTVVLEPKGHGVYYPITAYLSSPADSTLYKRLQGGKHEN